MSPSKPARAAGGPTATESSWIPLLDSRSHAPQPDRVVSVSRDQRFPVRTEREGGSTRTRYAPGGISIPSRLRLPRDRSCRRTGAAGEQEGEDGDGPEPLHPAHLSPRGRRKFRFPPRRPGRPNGSSKGIDRDIISAACAVSPPRSDWSATRRSSPGGSRRDARRSSTK